jgi:O-antigen ligase
MGVLVLAAAWEALRKPHRLVWALLTVAGAASVSAVLGLLEYAPWFNIQPWLQVFKPQATTVGGMLRLSGTFEYANGAAAYFELVTPLLLGLIIVFSSRHALSGIEWQWPSGRKRRALQIGLYVALALCVMSLLLTFSRAAWLGVGLALVVVAGGLWLRRSNFTADFKSPAWRAFGLAMLVMVLGTLWVFATQPLFRLRMLGENDREWYKNSISAGAVPTLTEGITVTVPVTVRNDGPVTWQAERAPVVNLSYHWREPGKPEYTIFEGMRTSLPRDVGPGESVTLDAVVWAPPKEGEYLLEWDMVQEHVTWFFQKSRSRAEPTSHKVLPAPEGSQVIRPPLSAFPRVNVNDIENYDSSTVARMQLWRVAWAMFKAHPLTGVGPDGFRNLYGPYAGTTSWNRNIYTNSTYIEMFTNLGILGGAAFLWLVGLALWRAIKATLRSPAGATWALSLGAMASLVAFLVHGFVDYFLFSTPLYVMFWLVVGIAGREESMA